MNIKPIKDIKIFKLFTDFSDVQCDYIIKNSKEFNVPENKTLLKIGTDHTHYFMLLEGKIKLTATDGKESVISADTPNAKNPIAQLRPSRYHVSTLTDVKIMALSEENYNNAVALSETEEVELKNISVEDIGSINKQPYNKIFFDILCLLHTDQLKLPSLPDIALKIRHAVENEKNTTNKIIKIINMDQSIVTKILKTANSALYHTSGKKIESVKTAFIRIGSKKLINLVHSYALKELFNSNSSLLKAKMNEIWKHSVKVAAISYILARMTPGFDPEKALLAGLLHNIGSVVILNNLGDNQPLNEDPELITYILDSLQAEAGRCLLEKWKFPNDLIEVAEHSSNWYRDEKESPVYSDIINIAQLHSYIGTPLQKKFPRVDEVPAFKKLASGQLTPELSLQLIEQSQTEIDQTIALFN